MENLDEETKEFLTKIGKKIYEKRKEKRLTQEQLGELLGMTSSGYAKIERGLSNFSISRLVEVAKKLDVELGDILQEKETTIFINSDFGNNKGQITVNQPTEIELLKSAFTDLQKAMSMIVEKLEILEQKEKEV